MASRRLREEIDQAVRAAGDVDRIEMRVFNGNDPNELAKYKREQSEQMLRTLREGVETTLDPGSRARQLRTLIVDFFLSDAWRALTEDDTQTFTIAASLNMPMEKAHRMATTLASEAHRDIQPVTNACVCVYSIRHRDYGAVEVMYSVHKIRMSRKCARRECFHYRDAKVDRRMGFEVMLKVLDWRERRSA